ncbi:MAG: hypothetical protein ABRQ39_29185 [Candidatus Eremiobacterota bacterium]
MPEMALKMAQIENRLGISSTYYFRKTPEVFNPKVIGMVADLGHEVGYHYEVLDKASGDHCKAIKIFNSELDDFRRICSVDTICMHGNPTSKWLNRDIWLFYTLFDYKLIGEAYLSLDFNRIHYISDTGRSWNSEARVKDYVSGTSNSAFKSIKKTPNLIKILNKKIIRQVCINVHPQRWSDEMSPWIRELIGQNIKNIGKICLKAIR